MHLVPIPISLNSTNLYPPPFHHYQSWDFQLPKFNHFLTLVNFQHIIARHTHLAPSTWQWFHLLPKNYRNIYSITQEHTGKTKKQTKKTGELDLSLSHKFSWFVTHNVIKIYNCVVNIHDIPTLCPNLLTL